MKEGSWSLYEIDEKQPGGPFLVISRSGARQLALAIPSSPRSSRHFLPPLPAHGRTKRTLLATSNGHRAAG